MYRIIEGNSLGLLDVGKFIDMINEPPTYIHDFFDQKAEIYVARAPGRLDVMGGIADYSGSLVLEMPIAEATLAAVQKSVEKIIKIVSLFGDSENALTFEMNLSALEYDGGPRDYYETAREIFSLDLSSHWASYIAGVFFVLKQELGIDFQNGARILIWSNIPIGKGVSSSAALEVAVMNAVCPVFDIRLEPRELALLCQKVENQIVGAACGVMDQVSANCGMEGSLISILCQPAEIQEFVKIPDAIEFWGIDSGVRHAVAGSDYTSVRTGAFMGYRIIADLAGLETHKLRRGVVEIHDTRWHGYLCNISPAEYKKEFASKLPEAIDGGDFIERYGGSTDRVTVIDPARSYAIRAPTQHAIYENLRVRAFCELLKVANSSADLDDLGELMFQSHASYSACGLTVTGTDRIAELVRENHDRGLFGARITGGGSGGTVAILARRGSGPTISEIANRYERDTGRKPYVFHGSSPGCSTFGRSRLSSAPTDSAIRT